MSEVVAMRRSEETFTIGPGLTCDLQTLVDSRLLVQANSGGGKSWCLRRLLEQTHGRVQQLVIDPEGEFASLREQFDYVLAARQGGDTAADPRSAKLLAERLLELGVSAILDIYELKAHDRVRFVRFFLEALVNAPKALWHPTIIVVDEAHVFCPQQGEAESAGPVIDLATRGRKRGFCAVLATQRISKLHKDAAAECNNKLIGRTALDVDMARAGDELGMGKGDRMILRDLRAGEFYAFGPAFSGAGVQRVHVGTVQTTHPKAGGRLAFTAPPPTAKVRAMLPKLADLPAEAEARERTVADLQSEIAGLKRELTAARRQHPTPAAEQVPALTDHDREILAKLEASVQAMVPKLAAAQEDAIGKAKVRLTAAAASFISEVGQQVERARAQFLEQFEKASITKTFDKIAALKAPQPLTLTTSSKTASGSGIRPAARIDRPAPPAAASSDDHLPPAKRKILNALALLEGIGVKVASRSQLAFLSDSTSTSGSYINNLSALRTAGLIDYPSSGCVVLTETGRKQADSTQAPSTVDELHALIRSKVPPAQWRILDVLIRRYPESCSREQLAEEAGSTVTSGSFINNLSALRTLGVLDYPSQKQAVATPVLFLEA
jgi:uncharacterized protein